MEHLEQLNFCLKLTYQVATKLAAAPLFGRAVGGHPGKYICNISGGLHIDILGPRLPTHTWRGRHMHEDSTGQKH